ncbi:hypothetical protein SAMN05444413_10533 [Roseivivax marinus]|uniref:hypothetical protein n=1 Tax=Roseivivax marinus TaxID=1379903 RepID=UPI0008D79623|nr:hypothetical protein [Roseivivax marinus]SEL00402.1 hypothetical protein SAMN05444413_10533 [Roseivivax marinus]
MSGDAEVKLDLNIPASMRGCRTTLDALDHAGGGHRAQSILRSLLTIVTHGLHPRAQQDFFENFVFDPPSDDLPTQDEGDIHLSLEVDDDRVEAARGDLVDMACDGSEWIRAGGDGTAAAVFEVLCDILEEGLPVADQQPLLDANVEDARLAARLA